MVDDWNFPNTLYSGRVQYRVSTCCHVSTNKGTRWRMDFNLVLRVLKIINDFRIKCHLEWVWDLVTVPEHSGLGPFLQILVIIFGVFLLDLLKRLLHKKDFLIGVWRQWKRMYNRNLISKDRTIVMIAFVSDSCNQNQKNPKSEQKKICQFEFNLNIH